jgi:hypothetical protein
VIYFYIKRRPGGPWDEVTFHKDKDGKCKPADRFWVTALLQGFLVERVG